MRDLKTTELPLWSVRLKREKQTVREHVAGATVEDAIAAAQAKHNGYAAMGVERVRQIGTTACDKVIIIIPS